METFRQDQDQEFCPNASGVITEMGGDNYMSENPKVFISHASEDKGRFVLSFAQRLREKGVNAWVDAWEMLPGDSLVDKIFNEGLRPADAVVVVLSDASVTKPWVQKELNTAVVKNIEDRTRLIPVRLDDCQIPECLRDPRRSPQNRPYVVTSKPANGPRPGHDLFYPFVASSGKFLPEPRATR